LIGPLSLRIPSDPVHLTTARSFAGAIGRVLGMDEGQRQDLRLAVSELVSVAIGAGLVDLSIVAELVGNAPVLRVKTEGFPPSIPPETSDLLGAMFSDGIWSANEPWLIRLAVPDDS